MPTTATAVDATRASYYVDATDQCYGDGVAGCSVGDLIAVGTKPLGAARWNHLDLSGNVAEWVFDAAGSLPDPCTDCVGTGSTTGRVVRGGSFIDDASSITTSARAGHPADYRSASIGARCARNP